ncbi:hypothetical protein QTO34_009306 [Cnephaeus nilssonii]|uniref:Uncharacterized protein n=1 Tax=Cnephaeus nilssonii TaxID=3371016 RepID=A0AA40HHK4_CNENI|nr:hypothetical protein QTO34_009306 [Eptesicus nilssonii]
MVSLWAWLVGVAKPCRAPDARRRGLRLWGRGRREAVPPPSPQSASGSYKGSRRLPAWPARLASPSRLRRLRKLQQKEEAATARAPASEVAPARTPASGAGAGPPGTSCTRRRRTTTRRAVPRARPVQGAPYPARREAWNCSSRLKVEEHLVKKNAMCAIADLGLAIRHDAVTDTN